MKTAIALIDYPYTQLREQQLLKALQDEAKGKAGQIAGIENPSETLWLIPLESGLSFLSWLIQTAGKSGLRCRVAFLDEPPNWIEPTTFG